MATKNYVDLTGLTRYDELIKEYISEQPVGSTQSDWTESDTTDPAYIKNKPTLGTAASKDVASSGDASSTQVVMGNDSRLTDEKVTQTVSDSYAAQYEILFSGTPDNTTRTEGVRKSQYFKFNPNSKSLTIGTRADGSTIGGGSCSFGFENTSSGSCSHAEGNHSQASNSYSHAEGWYTTASGSCSHAEGYSTTASGLYSHAEGDNSQALGLCCHAEGYCTTASNNYAHAEGGNTTASNDYAHAEGRSTTASGEGSHAEGYSTTASGLHSHTEGNFSQASGSYSHAEGYSSRANHKSQHVFGEYNIADDSQAAATARGNYIEIVGNGTSDSRSNARTLDWSGNETIAGGLTLGGGITLSSGTWDGTNTSLSSAISATNTAISTTDSNLSAKYYEIPDTATLQDIFDYAYTNKFALISCSGTIADLLTNGAVTAGIASGYLIYNDKASSATTYANFQIMHLNSRKIFTGRITSSGDLDTNLGYSYINNSTFPLYKLEDYSASYTITASGTVGLTSNDFNITIPTGYTAVAFSTIVTGNNNAVIRNMNMGNIADSTKNLIILRNVASSAVSSSTCNITIMYMKNV